MKILNFIKKEAVMLISFILATVSMLFVLPNSGYVDYIDLRTLALLFCLMLVMSGFNGLGLFGMMAKKLLNKANNVRKVILILVLLCFFSSMIITNDVALITFVPFTIITLKIADKSSKLIYTITLETVAANLGSMLTPIGNPQNLYLFSSCNLSIWEFFDAILPYAALSLGVLVVMSLLVKRERLVALGAEEKQSINKPVALMYTALFVISILCVFRLINYIALFVIVTLAVLLFDRKNILKADYSLLLTFVFLFIFIGNLGNISTISDWLKSIVSGNEVVTGVVASQVFSNVPATLLLSGFTNNTNALLIGVNLGGLGTLIASMASLISFKFIQKEKISNIKYLVVFTLVNLLFLALNFALWFIIK